MTIYISFDVETTGTLPSRNSMVAFGCAAYLEKGWEEVGSLSINIEEEFPKAWDADTLAWWNEPEQDEARAAWKVDPQNPHAAMKEIITFLTELEMNFPDDGPLVFAAYPITFDWGFLNDYMLRYCKAAWKAFMKRNGYSGLDIHTLAASLMGVPLPEARKKHWPKEWQFDPFVPHVALHDAVSQALSLHMMLQEQEIQKKRLRKVWDHLDAVEEYG